MRCSDVWKSLMALDNSIPFVFMGQIAATLDHDMLKVIELEHLNRYREIRVTFGIMALCDEYCSVDISNKELSKLNPKYYSRGYPGPSFGKTIDRNSCDIIVSDIILHILPLFKQATDAGNALRQLIRIDEVSEQNRLRYLSENGMSDRRYIPFETERFLDDHYFYLAMKSQNYDFMCNSLQTRIDNYNERIQELDKQINETQGDRDDKQSLEQSREKLCERVKIWTDYLQHAEIHNADYFNKIITENERHSLYNMPKQLLKI